VFHDIRMRVAAELPEGETRRDRAIAVYRLLCRKVHPYLSLKMNFFRRRREGKRDVLRDRHALLALYRSTGGASWKSKTNWDTDAPLATWYGVEVNDQGCVVKLDLQSNNLKGTSNTLPSGSRTY